MISALRGDGRFTTPVVNATTGFQINAAATLGNYLRGNGTDFVSSTIQSGDLPAGTGTVTSFSAGTLSPLFTTSVATATTTPALSFTLNTQNANLVFAGPTSGGAAGPTFRALVSADIPALPYISTGLMTTHGDIIYENATPAPARLGIGSTGQVLTVVAGQPAWAAAASGPAAWATLTGTLSNGQVIPYADAGISRLGATNLAVGNGTNGSFAGTVTATQFGGNAGSFLSFNATETDGFYLRDNAADNVISGGDVENGIAITTSSAITITTASGAEILLDNGTGTTDGFYIQDDFGDYVVQGGDSVGFQIITAFGPQLNLSDPSGNPTFSITDGAAVSASTLSTDGFGTLTLLGFSNVTMRNAGIITPSVMVASNGVEITSTYPGETTFSGHLGTGDTDIAGVLAIASAGTSATYSFVNNYIGTNPPIVVCTQSSGVIASAPKISYGGSAGAWSSFTITVAVAIAAGANFNYFVIDNQ